MVLNILFFLTIVINASPYFTPHTTGIEMFSILLLF